MQRVINSQDIGSFIRQRRKDRGFTQQELADLSGCSLMFLSDLENGKTTAQLGKTLQVIQTLGVDIFFQKREKRP